MSNLTDKEIEELVAKGYGELLTGIAKDFNVSRDSAAEIVKRCAKWFFADRPKFRDGQ